MIKTRYAILIVGLVLTLLGMLLGYSALGGLCTILGFIAVMIGAFLTLRAFLKSKKQNEEEKNKW